jgi:hypothetical protein
MDENDASIGVVAESGPPEMLAKSSSSPDDDSLRCNLHVVSAIVIKSIAAKHVESLLSLVLLLLLLLLQSGSQ